MKTGQITYRKQRQMPGLATSVPEDFDTRYAEWIDFYHRHSDNDDPEWEGRLYRCTACNGMRHDHGCWFCKLVLSGDPEALDFAWSKGLPHRIHEKHIDLDQPLLDHIDMVLWAVESNMGLGYDNPWIVPEGY